MRGMSSGDCWILSVFTFHWDHVQAYAAWSTSAIQYCAAHWQRKAWYMLSQIFGYFTSSQRVQPCASTRKTCIKLCNPCASSRSHLAIPIHQCAILAIHDMWCGLVFALRCLIECRPSDGVLLGCACIHGQQAFQVKASWRDFMVVHNAKCKAA